MSAGLLPDGERVKSLRELEKATTAIHQLCQGVTASQVACPKCEVTTTCFESFTEGGLSLEITAATDSLEEMLENFTCPERLDKENKLTCSGCQQKVRASRQLSLFQAPNILCVHLKRFRPGFQGKVNKPIQFEPTLRLRHFMTPGSGDSDPEYELLAVLVHLDVYNISSFGHYIAFVVNSEGQWWCTDDSLVEPVSKEVVLQQNAYMLFYQRKGDLRLFTTALEGE